MGQDKVQSSVTKILKPVDFSKVASIVPMELWDLKVFMLEFLYV